MGLTLKGEFDKSPEYDMGYGAFFALRVDVALAISDELGKHYRNAMSYERKEDQQKYNSETKRLLAKHKPNKGVYMFLYQPDCGGILSYGKCKGLLKQLQGITGEREYGYLGRQGEHLTMEKFRKLLNMCIERKKSLVWY